VPEEVAYQTERLDHLGIVAGVCREVGIAEWLDERAGEQRRDVRMGTATVAMILNGLGFSNRQLYLVPQYFENKPVEHLLGKGITADMLNDDCLGRTLDWLYEHDVTTLFAGLALQARRRFGIAAEHLHIDTTSFCVSGDYGVRIMDLPQGKERWVIVRTYAQMQATQEQMEKKVQKSRQEWEKRLWHLSNQSFACETDAQQAWKEAMKGKPS
jgi:transposase